jgi:hypothetical protein
MYRCLQPKKYAWCNDCTSCAIVIVHWNKTWNTNNEHKFVPNMNISIARQLNPSERCPSFFENLPGYWSSQRVVSWTHNGLTGLWNPFFPDGPLGSGPAKIRIGSPELKILSAVQGCCRFLKNGEGVPRRCAGPNYPFSQHVFHLRLLFPP